MPETDPPTTEAGPAPSTPPRRSARRAVAIRVLLAACGIAAAAGLWVASNLSNPDAAATDHADRVNPTLTYRPPDGDASRPFLTSFTNPRSVAELTRHPDRTPLDREPAGLPAPAPDAVHERRYRVAEGGLVDEVSHWRLPASADPDAVAQRYRDALANTGFVAIAPAPSAPRRGEPSARMTFIEDGGAGGVLTLRVTPSSEGYHATVWLRYAK